LAIRCACLITAWRSIPLDDQTVKSRDTAATPEVAIFSVNDAEAKFAVNMKGFTQAWPICAS
jgi:hypothetical protein